MKRLTIRNNDSSVSQPADTTIKDVFYRLAEYEDTGLTPEAVWIAREYQSLSPICDGCDGKDADGFRTDACEYEDGAVKCVGRALDMAKELEAYRALGSLDSLGKLVQAEQEGQILAMPCKVGDKIYAVTNQNKKVVEDEVFDFDVWSARKGAKVRVRLRDYNDYVIGVFGETIFLTREEAEAALEGARK